MIVWLLMIFPNLKRQITMKNNLLDEFFDNDESVEYNELLKHIEDDNNRKKKQFAKHYVVGLGDEMLKEKQKRERITENKKRTYIKYIKKHLSPIDNIDPDDLQQYSLYDVIVLYNTIKDREWENNWLRKIIKMFV
jgi:hypothetical protein